MPKDFSRTRRIGEQMQRELAQLIQMEVHDPRLGMVTVADVEVSRDLAVAKVYITSLDEGEKLEQSMAVLKNAAGFLRHELGQRMTIRFIPELRFIHDVTIQRGNELAALIDKAVAGDKQNQND
ncbi:MAG: 30S ribosome-binding factor RbfA [Gammaproteobacteria bacterium]|nr:30S ribosome-binding factor RbfA [Gammaproteobacteria bacterium]MDH5653038.1 30S ribosome-binding factor RbfA [Gammaproteobacteria bacterium]